MAVGDDVVLGRIEAGDLVRVDCRDSLAFELLEPGKPVDEGEEYTRKDLPEGVLFGRRVTTTVELLSIAAAGKMTTFRSHDGSVHTVDVEARSHRMRLAQLHPGDDVEVVFTEKLEVQLER